MNIQVNFIYNDLASSGIRKLVANTKAALNDLNNTVKVTDSTMGKLTKTVNDSVKGMKSALKTVTADVKKIGGSANDVARNFSSSMRASTNAMNNLSTAVDKVTEKMEGLQNTTNKKAPGTIAKLKAIWKDIGKIAADESKNGFQKILPITGQVAKAVGISYFDMVSYGAKQAWSGIKKNAVPFAKETMGKGLASAAIKDEYKLKAGDKQGGKLYDDVGNYARSTVYGPELHNTAKGMLELGMNAEQVMPAMRMLGEVASGNQEKMDMLSVAFAKTATSGKLTKNELEQYKKAGFDPLETIAKTSGAKYSDLQAQMDKGGISSGMVNSALATATGKGGQFDGALAAVAQSPQGMMQNLQNTVEQAKIEFGVALAPAIGQLLTVLQPVIDHLPVIFNALQPIVESLFTRLGELMPSILDLADAVIILIKPILDLLVSPEIGQLLKNIIDLSTAIATALTPVIKLIAWLIGKVVGIVNAVFEKVRKVFGAFMKDNPGIGEGWQKLTKGIDELTGSKDPNLERKPAIVNATAKATVIAPANGSTSSAVRLPPPGSTARPDTGQITGGGQKIVRISFRSVVEKMYNTVADTTGLVNTIEPRLDEAINRILAGVS